MECITAGLVKVCEQEYKMSVFTQLEEWKIVTQSEKEKDEVLQVLLIELEWVIARPSCRKLLDSSIVPIYTSLRELELWRSGELMFKRKEL